MPIPKPTYGARNRLLKRLGYDSYAAYLASPLWASIRERCSDILGAGCFRCRSTEATRLHHTAYDRATLLGEDLSKLVPVCPRCHLKIEFKNGGKQKRTLVEAQAIYATWTKNKTKRALKHLSPEQRKGLPGYCETCGNKAPAKLRWCRPCWKKMIHGSHVY